jgi:hypothetical protein
MNQSTPADASAVSIARIEAAINVWRKAQSAVPEASEILVLDNESRCLADLYGLMIYNGWATVPLAALSQSQQDALAVAEA